MEHRLPVIVVSVLVASCHLSARSARAFASIHCYPKPAFLHSLKWVGLSTREVVALFGLGAPTAVKARMASNRAVLLARLNSFTLSLLLSDTVTVQLPCSKRPLRNQGTCGCVVPSFPSSNKSCTNPCPCPQAKNPTPCWRSRIGHWPPSRHAPHSAAMERDDVHNAIDET